MIRPGRSLVPALACALLAACDFDGAGLDVVPEFSDAFSFESGMEEWTARAADLGDPPAAWEITRSGEQPSDGAQTVRFRLDDVGGEGSIWIERRWEVAPDQEYEVRITFDLVSADFGAMDEWRVLAGVSPDQPVDAADLVSPWTTGNGAAAGVGFQTVERIVAVHTTSDEDGELFVYLGIRATSAGSRTYHVDAVEVVMTRRGLSAPNGPTAVF